jgi:hypothetical protein
MARTSPKARREAEQSQRQLAGPAREAQATQRQTQATERPPKRRGRYFENAADALTFRVFAIAILAVAALFFIGAPWPV